VQSSRSAAVDTADYDLVAAEYYDPQRHPTCANFGELSARFLAERLLQQTRPDSRILEVGAGRSIIAPMLADAGRTLGSLTLLDKSAAMLAHSASWESRGAKLVVADACATSLPSASYDMVVASLCDPYNRANFWRESARIIVAGGICMATLPAPEWAARFRANETADEAEFVLANGRRVAMPSFVPLPERQLAMIGEAGLTVIEQMTYSAVDLRGAASPKLNVFRRAESGPVLCGFTTAKK